MAVLKYRASDGTIKTLGINQSGGIAGVSSVNGKTGAVTGLYDAENPPPYPVTSVNGKAGAVTGLYDRENPPPYPVLSVNSKTGIVVVTPCNVSYPNTNAADYYDITIPANSFARLINATAAFETDETTLPSGNTIGYRIEFIDTDNVDYPADLFVSGVANSAIIFFKSSSQKYGAIFMTNAGKESVGIRWGVNMMFYNRYNREVKLRLYSYY